MDTWKIIVIIIAIFMLGGLIFLGYVMSKIAYHPRRHYDKWNEQFLRTRFRDGEYENILAWKQQTPFMKLNITSFDKFRLYGRLYQAKSDQLVILLHGFETNSNTNLEMMKYYYEHNISVLAIDLRGHQDSEGNYVSYGHLERRDLRDWIEYVSKNFPNYSRIYLHGFSLGAATALRISDVPYAKVKLIISDCGFTSSTSAVRFSFKTGKHGYLPFWPIYFFSLLFNYAETGAWVPKSKPIEHIKKSCYPILFIQSRKDRFISYKMAKAMYDACPTTKDLAYFDAPHILASKYCYEEYTQKVSEFIDKHG